MPYVRYVYTSDCEGDSEDESAIVDTISGVNIPLPMTVSINEISFPLSISVNSPVPVILSRLRPIYGLLTPAFS